MSIGYSPLEDRILVKPIKKTDIEKTDAGIIIPDSAKREVGKGVVVAAGQGRYAPENGAFIPCMLSAGDIVLCGAQDGKLRGLPIDIETENGKEEVIIMREGDVLMLISKKSD